MAKPNLVTDKTKGNAMVWSALFSVASMAALLGWLALVLLPRWPTLLTALSTGLVGALCVAYSALMLVFFFRSGGGFGSLAAVRTLFASDPVLLAGWIHYLVFDLFVGIWIARQADSMGLSRLVQAPILLATFMFGPLGLLLFQGCQTGTRLAAPATHRSA